MTTRSPHARLIDELVAGATPVRPMPALWTGVAGVGLCWAALVLALGVLGRVRGDLGASLLDPVYAGALSSLIVAGLAASIAGLATAMPGRGALVRAGFRIGLGALLAGAGLCLAALATGTPGDVPPLSADGGCFFHAALLSVVPAAALFAYVLRGWVGAPARTAVIAVVGTFALGASAIHLACAIDGARHLLLGHLSVPVVMAAALCLPIAAALRRHAA